MNALKELTTRGIKAKACDGKVKLSGLATLTPDERDHVLNLAMQMKQELLQELSANPLGDHAHLVEWFLSVKDTLPLKRFCLWQEDGCSLWWATPAASYQVLSDAIETGPDGPHAPEVRSILELLHSKFGGSDNG